MIIYQVYNKVWNVSFESKIDAENYLSRAGTATNGLALTEMYVVDASQPSDSASRCSDEIHGIKKIAGYTTCPSCGESLSR